jgi:putative ABC transport system permease protein
MANAVWTIKVAIRSIVKARFVSILTILAFALGIGVTTAVFSIFNGVLIAPLPYPDPDELVAVYGTQPACSTCPASYPKYIDWKTRNHVFSAMGGSTQAQFVMTGNGDPTRVNGVATTASLADVFRVQPEIGRWYTEQEDQFGGPKLTVLSHDFWLEHFGADRNIIGRTVMLDGVSYEIIGVMPEGFSHRRGDLFVPLQRKYDPATRGNHFLATYARVKKEVPLEQAITEMRALGVVLAKEYGYNHGIDVRSYREAIVGDVRQPLRILLGAVLLVLLIACANVANLLLASALSRRREIAIRMALGAGLRQLAQQLATESVLMAVTGGAIGLALAQATLHTFIALAGNQLPRASTIAIDSRVLLFTAGVSMAVGLLCGLWPLFLLRARELTAAIREGDTRTGTASGRRFGNGLVVLEIAFVFALVAAAGLLVKNLILLKERDAGIRTDRIVTFDIAAAGTHYQQQEQTVAFYRELYSRLAGIGTVESVGMTSHLPMYNYGWNGEFQIEGTLPWGPNEAPLVEYRWIYGNYLQTIGVPLLKGRMLDSHDGSTSKAVLINQAMADKFWPGQDPLGKRFGQGKDTSQWYQVAGVIGNIRSYGLTRKVPYEFYRTIEESPFAAMTVVIRTHDENPNTVIPTARQIVASIDPSLPLSEIQTMEHVVSESVGQPRLMSALSGLFGALAGILTMVGVYGVMAYNVRRQRRDFGIRLALGAAPLQVKKLIVIRGLLLATLGVVLGGTGAYLLTGMLQTMLNDVKPEDPSIFIATTACVFLVVLAACYLPARSASRVDPMAVLRDS